MTTYSAKDADLAARLLRQEYLPPDFLGYMNDYLAMNQSMIPLSNIMGVATAMIPIGVPLMWLRDTIVPQGYVLLDGADVSRDTFVLLFDLWGTSFGVGDGSTTFTLPDFRGRIPVGKGTHADVDMVGDTEGESTVGNRRPKHKHTVTGGAHTHVVIDPGHQHPASRATVAGGGADTFLPGNTPSGTLSTNSAVTGITISSADATPTVGPQTTSPTDSPAYLVVNFITRYRTEATPQPVAVLSQPQAAEPGGGSSTTTPPPGGAPPGGPAIRRPTTPNQL